MAQVVKIPTSKTDAQAQFLEPTGWKKRDGSRRLPSNLIHVCLLTTLNIALLDRQMIDRQTDGQTDEVVAEYDVRTVRKKKKEREL